MNRRIVLCDIDHVISDAFWRDNMLSGASPDYDSYHYASREDNPNPAIVSMLQTLCFAGSYHIVGLTARPEKWRKLTMDWMIKHYVPMDELFMRPMDMLFEPTPKLKAHLIKINYPEGFKNISLVIDDREDVCAELRGMNLNVMQYTMRRA